MSLQVIILLPFLVLLFDSLWFIEDVNSDMEGNPFLAFKLFIPLVDRAH